MGSVMTVQSPTPISNTAVSDEGVPRLKEHGRGKRRKLAASALKLTPPPAMGEAAAWSWLSARKKSTVARGGLDEVCVGYLSKLDELAAAALTEELDRAFDARPTAEMMAALLTSLESKAIGKHPTSYQKRYGRYRRHPRHQMTTDPLTLLAD